MASILIVFESKYGQSSKIAEHIGESARDRGHAVRVLHVSDLAGVDVARNDAVAVVAPIYVGKHPRSASAFLRAHLRDLAACRRTAFFSVSNSAASSDPAAREAVRSIADAFVAEAGWRPDVVAIAAGAIAYPRYGFLTRFVMKRISRKYGGPTDTSRVHELTDWRRVDDDVAALLGPLEATGPKAVPLAVTPLHA